MNKLFTSNPNSISKTAYVNWRTQLDEGPHNLIVLGNAFHNSTQIALDYALDNNEYKIADSIIFPIIHNLNHSIELKLKALEFTLNRKLKIEQKFSGGHDIKQIYQTVLCRIKDLNGGKEKNEFSKIFVVLSDYIEEIYEKVANVNNNQKLEFTRYPVKKDKRNVHFYVSAMENIEIDLENLKDLSMTIDQSLDQALDYFYFN